MPNRIKTYKQAFEVVLSMEYDEKFQKIIKRLEKEGHSEKSICYAIWKSQDKLCAYRHDSRFMSILKNEINKWSWKKGDPRWDEYWKRKNQQARAEKIRKEIQAIELDEKELKNIKKHALKPPKKIKGYVYFIQGLCGGAIKIGYSANPTKRLKELQTGYPDTLTILLMIPGTEATERTIHRLLEGARLKGEWFRPDICVIDKIKELKAKYDQQ